MNVFISWSKAKGMKYALKTKTLLESLDPSIKAFVSEVDIHGGEDVQEKIIQKIIKCDKLVLCFTKETKKSPWLLFEAGYARGLKKTVIPMLFDDDPNWHSWVDNPMNVAREINFNHKNFTDVFFDCFGITGSEKNKKKLQRYRKAILDIKDEYRHVDVQCEDFVDKLAHNEAFVVENPFYRDKTAFFLTGFESFDLYKSIIDSFMYTGKYLWIYGRKNMKLFGGSFSSLFKYLEEKASFDGMAGIDFRCLFLDPESPEVEKAHLQQDIFKTELTVTISRAKTVVRDNVQLQKCFRLYSNKREEIIIRLDNCIVYARPNFDANGYPQLLTNSGFEVFSVASEKGKECIKKYETVWNNAKNMF